MIAKMIHGSRKIINVVTCNGEVGSGTLDGAGGRYFSSVLPVESDMTRAAVSVHGPLPELADNVEVIGIEARSENGTLHVPDDEIRSIIQRCETEKAIMILHTVLGSKTGICEPGRSGGDVISVVDACQGRLDLKDIRNHVINTEFALFTGSKFFRAPPFCGAVFVPGAFADLLKAENMKSNHPPSGIKNFLTSFDVSPELSSLARDLNDEPNLGLYLRWTAGLYEIEQTVEVSYDERVRSEKLWRKLVTAEICNYPNMEILPDSYETDTIISIKIRESLDSDWMTKPQLHKIYKLLTWDVSNLDFSTEEQKEFLKLECFVGQPVEIGRHFAVLRLATDSETLRKLRTFEQYIEEDFLILKKLDFLTRHFSLL